MFKKTIEFENFNGETVRKDFYFHLSKMELMRLAADGSMEKRIRKIMESEDKVEIIREFEGLIRLAYGVRGEDGESFTKDEVAQATLFNSPAYDELLVELMTEPTAATEFFGNLLPEKQRQLLIEQMGKATVPDPFATPEDTRPAYQREHRHPRNDEMLAMTKTELMQAFAWREANKL
jgi:hypothetical protein